MSLTTGARLCSYEIVAAIGSGEMVEVITVIQNWNQGAKK